MLSDVMFDGVEGVRWYQQEYPHIYEEFRAELDSVKAQMEIIRVYFDEIDPVQPLRDRLQCYRASLETGETGGGDG